MFYNSPNERILSFNLSLNSPYGMYVFLTIHFKFLQITPAHDPNDFEVGKRHNLEFINIFTDDGKINSNGGPEFAGMPRFKAREAVVAALHEKVLVLHISVLF